MDREHLSDLVHRLNDVELAVLLSLVAERHCILTTETECLGPLQKQVESVGREIFGLTTAAVQCTAGISLEEFSAGAIIETPRPRTPEVFGVENSYFHFNPSHEKLHSSRSPIDENGGKVLPNVVIARSLDLASEKVHAQALELMRTRKLVTRTGTFTAPTPFLFIALLSKTPERPSLPFHLLDTFFISHHHPSPNSPTNSSTTSLDSIIIRKPPTSLLPPELIPTIRTLSASVFISSEISRYIHDIVVFLRMHRAVASGVSAAGTRDFTDLVKCLAAMHSLDFVTPGIVALAVWKVYAHRMELVQVDMERSLLWGSTRSGVEGYLRGLEVERVVEEVLGFVRVPV
ncbi:hypothetical protein RUND412_006111 [Rhizina undulata]